MKTYIRPLTSCGKAVQGAADPHASRIVFIDRKPTFEISRRDGKFWIRGHNAPQDVPFRPLCKDHLAAHVQEYIDFGIRPAGGWPGGY